MSKGNEIPGVSPHLGRVGLGYNITDKLLACLLMRNIILNSFIEVTKKSLSIKVPGYWLLNAEQSMTCH